MFQRRERFNLVKERMVSENLDAASKYTSIRNLFPYLLSSPAKDLEYQ